MIVSVSKKKKEGIEIDLSGSYGNAFYLITKAKQIGEALKMTRKQINEVKEEMMSGDYEHLINVFDRNYGHFVTLYR